MKITRTYPQPDSPAPHLGARERAMAVYKYLLDIEPEAAVKHPLFACIVHAFEQVRLQELDCWVSGIEFRPSLVAELSGSRELAVPASLPPDDGPL